MLDELLYADDVAKIASTEKKIQEAIDQVSEDCDNSDLKISRRKTEIVYQQAT